MVFNQYNKNHLIAQLEAALKAVKDMPVINSCHTCANFDEIGRKCSAANAVVPAEIIEKGCESYNYDHTIPPW